MNLPIGDNPVEIDVPDTKTVFADGRVLLWVPQNSTPELVNTMKQRAGQKWPGMTLEIVNPKYFNEADLMLVNTHGVVIPDFLDDIGVVYKQAGVEVLTASGALLPTAIPREVAPPQEKVDAVGKTTAEPTAKHMTDGELAVVEDLLSKPVKDLNAILGTVNSVEFVKTILQGEKAKSKPRKTALTCIDEHMARCTTV